MNRTLKLSIMLALAMGGGHAWAQNLGPVQLRSTMEQPLVAEIPLTGVSGSLDNIQVALASEDAFSRAGLNRAGLPVALNFSVAKNAGGQPVIRVTSSAPVRDTYLDFLVEVSSGGNKVIREVTMLLDPPGTPISAPSSGAPAPTARPSRTSEVPTRAAGDESRPARGESAAPAKAPVPTEAPAPARAAAPARASAPASADGSIGPIQRGQTLSTIAREHAGGGDLNQMLVALHKANPDAFYRDNINALKTGAVLRVPSPEDVRAQSAGSALAEVRRQNEEWRSGSARKPSLVADGASTGVSRDSGKASTPANDRLAIVPSKEGGEAASTRAGGKDGKGDAQIAGLKQELTTQQENVASLKQQGAELKSRIGDLEEINSKNQRLLSLKDSEIAELQRKLAEARKAGGQPAAAASAAPAASVVAAPSAAAAPTATASSPTPLASTASAPATSASAPSVAKAPASSATVATAPLASAASAPKAATPVPAPAAQTPVKKPTPIAPTVVEEDPWYMQPWAWGGGAIVILLLLVAAVFRRKQSTPVAAATPASLADRFGQEANFGEYGHDGEHGHNDAIDQDQREILDALAEHPDDIGLHLELVSLYYARRDVDHFEAATEAMFAHVADPDQPEWREVMMMGEELAPSHPLFGGTPVDAIDEPYDAYTAATPHTADEVAALEEFDLGSYVTGPEESDVPPRPAPTKHSEYHFNFDLTPVQRAEADRRPNAPDVFDVDAPESPYNEAARVEPTHAATFGDILGEETRAHDEVPSTWSFDADHDRASPLIGNDSHLDAPHLVDAPHRADEPHHLDASDHVDAPRFDEPPAFPTFPDEEPLSDHSPDSFSDDPVDTKLDLARAYLDMGDAEGARLMLEEVISEGTQMQKDTARRILDDIV